MIIYLLVSPIMNSNIHRDLADNAVLQVQQLETETQAVRGQMTRIITQHESELQATRKDLQRLYQQIGKYNSDLVRAMDTL